MPPPSWPRMTGKRPCRETYEYRHDYDTRGSMTSGSLPLRVYSSVWQIPGGNEYRRIYDG